jgi:hypothetical protein
MLDALKKKDKNKTQVSVEIDLDDLEGFRITVLPECNENCVLLLFVLA